MTVHRKGTDVELLMNQDPQENSCRPAVDVLFRSVADVYGLTGLGGDSDWNGRGRTTGMRSDQGKRRTGVRAR